MKKINWILTLIWMAVIIQSCSSVAPTQYYRPQNYSGEPYRISGRHEPMSGWAGKITITINEQPVITANIPVFSNSVDAKGTFKGKTVSAFITHIESFTSSYYRADVFIANEKAATLTF